MREGHHKGHPRVAQPGTEEMGRGYHASQDDLGGTPINFGLLTGVEGEGHEDRALLAFEFAHRPADGRLGAAEAMLVPQLAPDLMGGAALFARLLQVVGEPLADQRQHCRHDGHGARLGQPVARHRIALLAQVLADGFTGKAELAGDAPLGPALH